MAFDGVYRGARVFVTGHTGFKGSWLIQWLADLGAQVTGYSVGVPTNPALFDALNLGASLTHVQGDVRDFEALGLAMRKACPDFVFHLAAQAIVSRSYREPLETFSTNALGTATLLEAVRSFAPEAAVVLITSDKCYENVEWLWGYREVDALGGADIYSASKAAAELVFSSYWRSFLSKENIRAASARAGNVIGGGDWAQDRVVVDAMRAWARGERVIVRNPQATRPWQHVLEPLSGYLALGRALADGRAQGESFNFGPRGEQAAAVATLLKDLSAVWGFADENEAVSVVETRAFHEAGLLKLSIEKAHAVLNWSPTLHFEECVELTAGWYKQILMEGGDAGVRTRDDIARYSELASSRGLEWVN